MPNYAETGQEHTLLFTLTKLFDEMEESVKREPEPHRLLEKIVEGYVEVHIFIF